MFAFQLPGTPFVVGDVAFLEAVWCWLHVVTSLYLSFVHLPKIARVQPYLFSETVTRMSAFLLS